MVAKVCMACAGYHFSEGGVCLVCGEQRGEQPGATSVQCVRVVVVRVCVARPECWEISAVTRRVRGGAAGWGVLASAWGKWQVNGYV